MTPSGILWGILAENIFVQIVVPEASAPVMLASMCTMVYMAYRQYRGG